MMLETTRLQLKLQTPAEVLAWVDSLDEATRREVSPVWIERVRALTEADPWSCSFVIHERAGGSPVGSCAFKGPPDADRAVEIAYGIDPEHQRLGYATEAAGALVAFATGRPEVGIIRAHTRADHGPSASVLRRNGFVSLGEVIDPEDGPVIRWERSAARP
jgi:RimJ/RimL family protein N-acetyltransferase